MKSALTVVNLVRGLAIVSLLSVASCKQIQESVDKISNGLESLGDDSSGGSLTLEGLGDLFPDGDSDGTLPEDEVAAATFDPNRYANYGVLVRYPRQSNRGFDALAEQITDSFMQPALSRGYELVDRDNLQHLLEEQNLQVSGITTAADAVKAGRIANLQGIFLISVTDSGKTRSKKGKQQAQVRLSGKLLDVETGKVVWIRSDKKAKLKGDSVVDAAAEAATSLGRDLPRNVTSQEGG